MKTIIVFKTHVDLGFTDLTGNVIKKYTNVMLPATAQVCEETQKLGIGRHFIWTVPSFIMKHFLDPEHVKSDILRKAESLASSGQLVWHALPFTTHTEFCGLEEYIRGLMISGKISAVYDKWPISAKMTDVPGHAWMLPSVLYKAGIKFLHIGSNISVSAPDVPRLFWWEGPDGNRVLTFYSMGDYGTPLIPPEDWAYPVWLSLMHTGDNQGPQKSDYIEDLFKRIDEEHPHIDPVIGTMDDFYNELIKYPLDIPVIRKDLADAWNYGTGSYPKETAMLRELRGNITELEKLSSFGKSLGFIRDDKFNEAQELIADAYENCLLFGEHTWGIDVKTALNFFRQYEKSEFIKQKCMPGSIQAEDSWNEQRERCYSSINMITSALSLLADNEKADKELVFNGLGWQREGLPAFGYEVRDVKQKSKIFNHEIKYDTSKGFIENKWYRLDVDPDTGSISRLFEKSINKDWVDRTDIHGFGQYRYDIYGLDDITDFLRTYSYHYFDWSVNDLGRMYYPKQKHLTYLSNRFEITSEQGEDYVTLIMSSKTIDDSADKYGNARNIITKITLYKSEPVIDICYELSYKEETPFVEAGHFVFPVKLDRADIALNKFGCVIDVGSDIQKGANNALYCIENFIDVSNGNYGIAFIPRHAHLVSAGDQNILKYKNTYEEVKPTLFFNAFNNAYGTNFPQWMSGSYTYEFRIIPHNGDWKQGDIYRKAIEYMIPVIKIPAPCAAEHERAGWFDGMEGMAILAFKKAEKDDGFILRLHDITGERNISTITFPDIFNNVSICDLQERITEHIENKVFSFVTKPYEIHSFYMK